MNEYQVEPELLRRSRRDCGNREADLNGVNHAVPSLAAVAATAAIVRRLFVLSTVPGAVAAAVAATAAIVRR